MRNWSIKRKLTLITMAVSTLALLLVAAGFMAFEWVAIRSAMMQNLKTQAQMTAERSVAAVQFETEEDARQYLDTLRFDSNIVAACIYNTNSILAAYHAPGFRSEVIPRQPRPDGIQFDFPSDSLTVFQTITLDNAPIGALYLKSNLQTMRARLRQYAELVAIFLVLSWVLAWLLSSRLQRVITRPVFNLVETAKSVSKQRDYSVRARKHADDELGQLIDGFNEMLGQIQNRDAALQQNHDLLEKRVEERTRDLLQEIAERRRAESALQEQFTRTSLLNQITQVISERQDLESILYVVLRQLEDHFAMDLGLVLLFDPAAETLNLTALRARNALLLSKLNLREGMVLLLDETGFRPCVDGEAVTIADTRKRPEPLPERFAAAGFRSAVAVPLMVENKLFGVLLVGRLNPDSINAGELEFLRTLSKEVALAAHQAQLHAKLQQAYDDLRQTQATVMQQERLKALGQMASGIAHDINNALSPVVGFADLLARAESGLSDNGKKYLQYIKTAGEDIAHIVARLREFYRRRAEREELLPLNLNEVIRQVVDMTRPRWRDIPQGRGIMVEVRTELADKLPEFAGIESEVREALTNLVLNAVDAVPGGGTIVIRTQAVANNLTGRGEHRPTHVIVEVTDNGSGMDEQTRKRCMEPFFSTKGKRGTGMGLAMVYGVVERHEGKIEIDSEIGRGTTMRLIFPIRSSVNRGVSETDSAVSMRSLRVLCIDDEPLVRELLKEMLERDGHKVMVTDGGLAGVEAFRAARSRREPFDVVLTDLGMPYLDGRQVSKILKRESPQTPVIMLTGWGAFMKEDGETPAQVDGVLSKPPRSTEIRAMLRRVVFEQKPLPAEFGSSSGNNSPAEQDASVPVG